MRYVSNPDILSKPVLLTLQAPMYIDPNIPLASVNAYTFKPCPAKYAKSKTSSESYW